MALNHFKCSLLMYGVLNSIPPCNVFEFWELHCGNDCCHDTNKTINDMVVTASHGPAYGYYRRHGRPRQ